MAIFKIFAEKDATLYSYREDMNTGLDQILELQNINSNNGDYSDISRIVIKFSQKQIDNLFDNTITNKDFKCYLRLFLADARGLKDSYSINAYPLKEEWEMGLGMYSDYVYDTQGVSWKYRNSFKQEWTSSADVFSPVPSGGGSWYSNYISSQSFNLDDEKDIFLDVTDSIKLFYSSSKGQNGIDNNGFIVKAPLSLESGSSNYTIKYFSKDTHTIYPPQLEFRYDDFHRSSSLIETDKSDIVVTLANNKKEFNEDSIQRFRINVRDRFPARAFQTTSIYLNNKILPEESYYAIKDLDTEEYVVDFNEYTKLNADSIGNYFDINMGGLQPERYYQILIKSTVDNSTIIMDDDYYFKVIR